MKKIVLTLAVAFAATSAFAQVNATDETPTNNDVVSLGGALYMVDMIDLVPELQFATNVANTWAEYNNGLQLNETGSIIIPNPPPLNNPLNDIEFRVSATRPFSVSVKNSVWTRAGGGAPAGVVTVFAPSDFNILGLPSPQMGVGAPASPGGPYAVDGHWGGGALGTGDCANQSAAAMNLSGSDQTLLTAQGCYNRQFDVRVALRPGYAYNHSGYYSGTITVTGRLNP